MISQTKFIHHRTYLEDYSFYLKNKSLNKFLRDRFDMDVDESIKQYKGFYESPVALCLVPEKKSILIEINEIRDFDTNKVTSNLQPNKKYFVMNRQRVGEIYFQEIVLGGYHVWEKESGREIIISKKEIESFSI